MPDYASMSTEELVAIYDADRAEGWDASWLLEFHGVADALAGRGR